MSVRATALSSDGFQVISKGVQSGLPPNTLPRDQLAWLVNGTTRNGFPRQRPGWSKRALTGDAITTGLFQGAGIFKHANELVLSRAGRIYAINLSSYVVRELTDPADRNSPILRRAWFCEGAGFEFVQDNQAKCLIYDGANMRRSDPSLLQVPTGSCMAYASGRLWVTLPGAVTYAGSDLVYGDSGTAAYGRRDAITFFKENVLYSGGGAFGIPFDAGEITAMVPLAQTDTSLGQGPLQVFTTGGAFSVNAPFDRATWALVTFPVQSASLLGAGFLSDWAANNVNGDIWGRAVDGVRSFQVARRDFGTWVNAPFSQEVTRALENDTRDFLGWSSGALFDNRRIQTIAPYSDYDNGILHRGLVVLDFYPLGGMASHVSAPVWDGEWSGLPILQVLGAVINGQERCFIIALGAGEDIQLWEISRDSNYDNDGATDRHISWQIEGASYNWPDAGWGLKQLEFGDTWYDQLQDEVTFSLYFRPDQEPCWQEWHSWSSCAVNKTCENPVDPDTGCASAPPNLQPQYRVRHKFPQLVNVCNPITGKPYRRGYEFQPRLAIQGPCRIKKFRLWASDVPEEPVGGCLDDSVCKTLDCCLPDPLSYMIEDLGCQGSPNIESFAVDPEEINIGDSALISWGAITNSSSASIDQGIGSVTTSPGSVSVSPTVTTTYTISVQCGASIVTRSVTVFVDQVPPPVPPVVYVPDDGLPAMSCSPSVFEWPWLETEHFVRYPSSGNHADDPNSILDPDLISWWASQVEAAFLAEITTSTSHTLFWQWSEASDSWNAFQLWSTGSHIHYISPGWTIAVAYCE
jgi:hypothetical protein